MDDVVRMIYDGDYAPADRLADKPPELREARENAYQSYAAFKKALTDAGIGKDIMGFYDNGI